MKFPRSVTAAALVLSACGGGDKHPATPATPAAPAGGVHAVDWMNHEYEYAWADEGGTDTYPVKDGAYADADGTMYLWVTGPTYGDLNGDGQDDAVIHLDAKAGDSLHYPKLVVFTADGADVKVLDTIDLGEVSGRVGQVENIAVANGALTFTRYENQEGEDFRTASLEQHETWKWNGTHFVEDAAARTTKPYTDPDAEPAEPTESEE